MAKEYTMFHPTKRQPVGGYSDQDAAMRAKLGSIAAELERDAKALHAKYRSNDQHPDYIRRRVAELDLNDERQRLIDAARTIDRRRVAAGGKNDRAVENRVRVALGEQL